MPEAASRTVIFDLDGTLVDSAPDLADTLDILLGEHAVDAIGLEGTRRLIGHGIPALVRGAMELRGLPIDAARLVAASDRFRAIYAERLSLKTRPYLGVVDALAELRADGWRMVVCTNKLEAYARAILRDVGLAGFFETVAGPDTFGVAKPDPRHLLNVLPPGTKPRDAVMVGDSEADVAAARAAAIPVVAVGYGYCKVRPEMLGADRLVAGFADVPAAVTGLWQEAAQKDNRPRDAAVGTEQMPREDKAWKRETRNPNR